MGTIEFAGKMNFYLELLDSKLKQADDNPSIGIILCPEKENIEVEYALRTTNKPIGVAAYKLTHKLPKELKGKLPTASEIKKIVTKLITS
ncbi:MAG: PDDEXK nuclease domain-containing protein [Chitinophagales bacterium]